MSENQRDLQARPNPDALLRKDGAQLGGSDDEDAQGVYKPPKMGAVHFEEEGNSRKERNRQRAIERAASTRMVRELRAELSDAPKMIHADDFGGARDADSDAVAKFRKEEEERRRYEEENFSRLQLTKAEKIKQKRRANAAAGVSIDDLGTFDDFSHLYETATSTAPDPREEKMAALRQYMKTVEQRGKKGGRKGSADEQPPTRTLEERSAKQAKYNRTKASDENDNDDDMHSVRDIPEEDPFYKEVASAKMARRKEKAARAAEKEAGEWAERKASLDVVADSEKREIGRQIAKNRGLTRERKKIDSNPRVKNREKFRKASIRRKGQVRDVKSQSATYTGEATGIKKNVSHSVRFK